MKRYVAYNINPEFREAENVSTNRNIKKMKLSELEWELRKFSFLDVWSAHVAVWGNETSKFKKSINSQETKLHLKVITFKYLQVSYQLKIVFSPSEIRHKKENVAIEFRPVSDAPSACYITENRKFSLWRSPRTNIKSFMNQYLSL